MSNITPTGTDVRQNNTSKFEESVYNEPVHDARMGTGKAKPST